MTRRAQDPVLEQNFAEMGRLMAQLDAIWARVDAHLSAERKAAQDRAVLAESQAVARRVAALGERGAR